MWEQEKEHVKKFEELLPKYRVRPTALLPFWNVAGYALGNMSTTIVKLCLPSCSFFKKHPYCFSATTGGNQSGTVTVFGRVRKTTAYCKC